MISTASAVVVTLILCLQQGASAQSPNNLSAILLVPKVIYEGEQNSFVLQLQNQQTDGQVNIEIVDVDNDTISYYEKDFDVKKADGPTFQLNVSDITIDRSLRFQRYGTNYKIIFTGKIGDETIRENSAIRIPKDSALLLVQTDKKIYKPGQKVFIRVMPLDYNLRPRSGGNMSITVNDPLNNVVASWPNFAFNDLVMQFDFKLTEEPPLGSWYINVRYDDSDKLPQADSDSSVVLQTSAFTVSEYVLPKFEVTITKPKFILMNAKEATWKICANYTFGKPVNGQLKINASVHWYPWERVSPLPEKYVEVKIKGCHDFTLDLSTLNATGSAYQSRNLQIVANVFEDKTNLQMNATSSIARTSQPLKLTFSPDGNEKYFRPYMNTYGSVRVSNPDDSVAPKEPISLCLTATSQAYKFHYQRTDVRVMCKNYTSDENGKIDFVLPPHKPSVVSLEVEATSIRFPKENFPDSLYDVMIYQPRSTTFYRSFFSPSEHYLQFEPLTDNSKLPCDKPVNLSAFYTFNPEDKDLRFRYVVRARSKHILTGEVTVAVPQAVASAADRADVLEENLPNLFTDMAQSNDKKIGRLDITIDPKSSQYPQLTVVLFYLNGTEVVADSLKVKRKVCSANKVDLSFSETVVQPGAPIGMTLKASPNSQCGYDVVDRSVRLLSGTSNNPFIKYQDELPDREISEWEASHTDYSFCMNGQSDFVDSESAFLPLGWNVVVHNVKLRTRPCRSTRNGSPDIAPELGLHRGGLAPTPYYASRAYAAPAAALSPTGSAAVAPSSSRNDFGSHTATATQSVVDVRDYFPEVWLFELSAVDGTGQLLKNLTAPHQVTTWNADATCINAKDGLGVAESKEVKTYQAFFTEVNLPYSVKRGENLPIVISTHNYLENCMPVSIVVDPIPGLRVDDTPLNKTVCICADASPFQYKLRARVTEQTVIGDLNITVTASNSEDLSVCSGKPGAKTVPSRDKVTRSLKIIPEGFQVEKVDSVMLCPKEESASGEFKLEIPADVINGSARSLFSVSGDMMGQAVSNVDHLIVLPTGCGEQNMAKVLSNLAVLKYLRATSQIDSKIENRIKKNLESGYQNQLKFRGRDGSYSAWGGHWGRSSSFLTAMVYRGFVEAKNDIFVDDAGQTVSLKYLLDTQDAITGCFNKIGSIYSHPLQKTESSTDTRGSYSAYMLAALHGSLKNESKVKKALLCVQAQKNMNALSLALSAYAAALYKKTEMANKFLEDLKSFENTKLPNQKFYASVDSGSSDLIETAAYSILAQLTLKSDDETLQKVQPIARWLMKKQNRNGGFSSSQDTVVGLQALAKFAELSYGGQKGINNKIEAKGTDFDQTYDINKDNAIIWDTRIVKTVPNTVSFTSKGTGCVVATSQLRYNVPKIEGQTGFDFNITVLPTSTIENVVLELCISYDIKGGQPSAMAIVDLQPFSGYTVDTVSLKALVDGGNARLHQPNNNGVYIYYSQFNDMPRCSSVTLSRQFDVKDLKPASAKVFDYYYPDIQKSIEYERGTLESEKANE